MPSEGPPAPGTVLVRRLGRQPYGPIWEAMKAFTDRRDAGTSDEIWLLEHPPVYTQGLAGRPEHLLDPGDIPVLHSDRGGQITYHGPGQPIAYVLLDLRRRGLGVRALVSGLEGAAIEVLQHYGVPARARAEAPGVYAGERKIASLGLRVRRGCSYHGIAFNAAMDLEPFTRIHPCGDRDLQVTQLSELAGPCDPAEVAEVLLESVLRNFYYTKVLATRALPEPPDPGAGDGRFQDL